MATPDQRPSVRPISFVFHNTDDGSAPVEKKLLIRPEELTRSDASRMVTHQTLGGAFTDSFGRGLPSVQLSGITGWGQGGLPDGQIDFAALYDTVYTRWHKERAKLVQNGKDPDKVKLIFNDELDGFIWVVAPQQFILKRSKSRPLLSQFHINLIWVSDDVIETMIKLNELKNKDLQDPAIDSFDNALDNILDFAANLSAQINALFGPLYAGINALIGLTANILGVVQSLIGAGLMIIDSVLGNIFNLAAGLSFALSNIMATVLAVQSVPALLQWRLMSVRGAFLNCYCILTNIFKERQFLPNYDDIYGASLCSSTAGGNPLSPYIGLNTFEAKMPMSTNRIAVDSDAVAAINRLRYSDVALNPMNLTELGSAATIAAQGIRVT